MYLVNHSRKFHQIYNLGAAGDKDKLITFCGQKMKVIAMLNKHFGRHFLTYLWNAWMYFNETYHTHSLPGPHHT